MLINAFAGEDSDSVVGEPRIRIILRFNLLMLSFTLINSGGAIPEALKRSICYCTHTHTVNMQR